LLGVIVSNDKVVLIILLILGNLICGNLFKSGSKRYSLETGKNGHVEELRTNGAAKSSGSDYRTGLKALTKLKYSPSYL
jgi:hypothetical protein